MDYVRSGEELAQEAQYLKDRLKDDLRTANLGYYAYRMTENPSPEEQLIGEFYHDWGSELYTALGIVVEHPKLQDKPVSLLRRIIGVHLFRPAPKSSPGIREPAAIQEPAADDPSG